MDILFFDTETTGIAPGETSVIEIGAVFYKDGVKHSQFESSFSPALDADINIKALAVNRATAESLITRGSPVTAANEFVDYLLKLPLKYRSSLILAGHNVSFDVNHVDAFLRKNRIVDFKDFVSYRTIDTAAIGQFLIDTGVVNSNRASLGILAKALEVPYDENKHHGALYDAELCALVYYAMADLVKKHTGIQHTRVNWIS